MTMILHSVMHVSQLCAVVLRLIAVRWLLEGLAQASPALRHSFERPVTDPFSVVLYCLMPIIFIAIAFLLWWFAGAIGRVITGASDPIILQGSISRETLFSTGILVMGLWTALTYLGSFVSWVHYLIISKKLAGTAENGDMQLFYDAMNNIIPCVAGGIFTVAAGPLGRRLAKIGPLQAAERENS